MFENNYSFCPFFFLFFIKFRMRSLFTLYSLVCLPTFESSCSDWKEQRYDDNEEERRGNNMTCFYSEFDCDRLNPFSYENSMVSSPQMAQMVFDSTAGYDSLILVVSDFR